MKKLSISKDYLNRLDDFGLSDVSREGILLFQFDKGEYLCREGEPIEHLLFIIRGRSKVSVTGHNGKSLLFSFFGEGEILGSIEVMEELNATASVQAITEMECIALPIKPNLEYLRNNQAFLRTLVIVLSRMTARSSKNHTINILYPLKTRVCAYIAVTHDKGYFRENLSRVNELLGSSYRHLLRTLDELCRDGVLKKEVGGYRIVDMSVFEDHEGDYFDFFDSDTALFRKTK